jgi:cobalamin biosynthesis protein CobD/CbiB
MAGALGIWLGGPSSYGGQVAEKPVIGRGGGPAEASSVLAAERMLIVATFLMAALTVAWQALSGLLQVAPRGWGVLA